MEPAVFFLHLFTVKNHCGFMSNVSSGNKGILSDGYGSKPCFCSQLRQLLDLPPSTLVSLTSLIKIGVSKRGKSLLQGEQSPKSLLDYWPYLRWPRVVFLGSHPKIAKLEAPGKWISISTWWDTFCTVFHETPAAGKRKGDDSLPSELKKTRFFDKGPNSWNL